jgi:quercetin dioxygenase-like cupin family protein
MRKSALHFIQEISMKIINLKNIENKDVTKEPLFTGGKVQTQSVLEEEFKTAKIQIVNVKFAAGARNKFHTHTQKQVLYVTEGKGIVADREKEYKLEPGMAVIIPPGEEHWHGAAKNSSFTHLSIISQPQEMKITE